MTDDVVELGVKEIDEYRKREVVDVCCGA